MPIPQRLSRLLFLAVLLVPALLAAQAPDWTPTGPFGGSVSSFAVHPTMPGVLYAAGSAGVVRTRDAGASWQWLPGAAELRLMAIDPTQPRTLYGSSPALPSRVFKSTDEGARWTLVSQNLPANLNITSLAVDPARPSRIYLAAANRGVWRSGNGGVTWQPVNQGLPVAGNTFVILAVPRRPAGTAFAAGAGSGLFRTRNAGGSWEPLQRGLPGGRVAALAIAPSDPQTLYASIEDRGIFRSRDSGSTWVPAGQPIPPAPVTSESHSLAVHPRSPLTVYAARYGTGVFRTTDGGRRWTPTAPPPSLQISTLAVDAGGAVYAGLQSSGPDAGGVLRSAGGGAPWERRNQGILGLQAFAVAVDPADPENLVTAVDGPAFFRSANAAARWVPVRGDFPPGRIFEVLTTEVVAGGAGTFYFVDLSRGPQRIWKSSDAGRTWTPLSGPGGRPQTVRADPLDPETLYALAFNVNDPRLYRSEDGGASWTLLPALPATCGTFDLEVARTSASAPAILYIGGSRVCRSGDGGATWSQADAGLPAQGISELAVDPRDPRTVYAGVGGGFTSLPLGIWKSTDSGASWRMTRPDDDLAILSLAASPEPGVVWASTFDNEVYRSTDFGETWQELSGGLLLEVFGFAFGPDRVYAATQNGVWVLDENIP